MAIDPGAMRLPEGMTGGGPGRVSHMQMLAQDAAGVLLEAGAGFDMLVCDANRKPQSVVQEMVEPLVPLLRPGAWMVVTLKDFWSSKGQWKEWEDEVHAVEAMVASYTEAPQSLAQGKP